MSDQSKKDSRVQLEELVELCQRTIDIQSFYYGNATMLHLAMINHTKKIRNVLSKMQ